MTIADDIQTLSQDIADFASAQGQAITDLNNAKLAAYAAAAEINATTRARSIYAATYGDDANPGTLAAPVRTAQRITELYQARGTLIINFLTDFVWDYYMPQHNDLPDYVKLYGRDDQNAYVNRTLTFVDSVNSATNSGSFRGGKATKYALYGLDVVLNTSKNNAAFENSALGIYDLSNGTISRNPASTGSALLFLRPFRAGIICGHANFIIDPTAAGYVFPGIAAGADPNTDNLIVSTFTSA